MVISIISLLMAILLPVLGKVRQQARTMLGMKNQREIVNAVTLFAADNDGQYPESVATVGFGAHWNWSDPRKLTGNRTRSPGMYRSMSEYLRSYIPDAGTFFARMRPVNINTCRSPGMPAMNGTIRIRPFRSTRWVGHIASTGTI